MNAEDQTLDLDGLFRAALEPMRLALPSDACWARIVRRLREVRFPRRRVSDWLLGLSTPPTISAHQPSCLQPFGPCRPAPIIEAMAVRLLDPRLAT